MHRPDSPPPDLSPAAAYAAPRYAVYFAPAPDSVWWYAGSQWLGRCAASGQLLTQPRVADIPPSLFRQLTLAPAHYGWHATLKAPFQLAPGSSRADLEQQLAALSQRWRAFILPPLQVARLGHFLALVPIRSSAELQAVADACVTELQPLAAPLPLAELVRRRGAGLTPRQEAYLQRWGYPYVLEQFKFHFSLSGTLCVQDASLCAALERAAQIWFASLPPCRFDALSLFDEPTGKQPMRLLGQWPLVAAEAEPGRTAL